ncbi:MAG: hypothetical protein H7222_09950 [Methylotenera sp.]|nr:hypothetical protein [Oligoflexia bacterium]
MNFMKPVQKMSLLPGVLAAIALSALFLTTPGHSSIPRTSLTSQQRDQLRFRLENNTNELELLVKNQKADGSDLNRQKRDEEALQLYQRIPLKDQLDSLTLQMDQSAKAQQVKLVNLRIIGRSSTAAQKIPAEVITDQKFKLTEDQLVEKIFIEAQVQGSAEQVKAWLDSWQENQMRLVEPRGGYGSYPLVALGKSEWKVLAQAFKFKDIQFPKLKPRDPLEVLPVTAKKNPQDFAKAEPMLWNIVKKSQTLLPQALPLFEAKREFKLNEARMNFFLSKALPTERNVKSASRGAGFKSRQRAGQSGI